MKFGSWRPWQKIALLNLACLLGIVMSAFVAPPDTPVWQWAAGGVFAFIVTNILIFAGVRRWDTRASSRSARRTWAILALAFSVLLLEWCLNHCGRR